MTLATATQVRPYNRDIKVLTSMRMIAATAVVVFHLTYFTRAQALIEFPLFDNGYLGVDFFFILSGFVLTHVYQPQVTMGRFDFWQFVVKRFARIYPLHFLMLIVCIFLAIGVTKGWIDETGSPFRLDYRNRDPAAVFRAFVANLTLIHAWGSTPGLMFNLPSWSISAEWFAYLMFPVFVMLRRLPPRSEFGKLGAGIALFFALVLLMEVVTQSDLTRLTWNLGIVRIFPEFLIGMSIHRLGETWSAGSGGSLAGFYGSFVLVIAALIAADAEPAMRPLLAAIAVIGMGGLVLFGADADRHGWLSLLKTRAAVYLGEISYAVYMVHMAAAVILFEVLFPHWRPEALLEAIGLVLFALLVVISLSALCYRYYEIPVRDWLIRKGRSFNVVEKPVAL